MSGISFTYFDGGPMKGEAPPLILIHGAGGTRLNWPPEIRRMKGSQVYALDLPGHGESVGEPESTVKAYARAVLSWMEERDLSKAIVAGHSMGGAITLTMALSAPERIAGIVLVSTGAKLRVHPDILALTSDSAKFHTAADLVTKWSFSKHSSSRMRELALKQLKEVQAHVANADFNACDCFDLMDELQNIHAPALVICGDEDVMTPVKYSRYLSENINGAELYVVPGAGHMVMLEKPTIVASAIRKFVEGVGGRQKSIDSDW